MTKKISVIIKEPDEPVGHIEEIRNELTAFQDIVGGLIEVVQIADGSDRILMICNEEGKLLPDLDPNIHVSVNGWRDIIFGTIIICGDWRQDFAECPIDLDAWQRLLRKWGN